MNECIYQIPKSLIFERMKHKKYILFLQLNWIILKWN